MGMMLYLAGSTRPNIAYDVHQCARLSHIPKRSHEIGVKHIAWYMKGTHTKCSIMNPDTENMGIDIYIYANFSGLYSTEDKMHLVSAKNRSGMLLTFGKLPILWSSKLQSEMSLSTLEAEYIVLSQGLRNLVSARRLMDELGKRIIYNLDKVSHVSKVW